MTDPTQDALHAERIERLTQLAREVWPDRDEQMVIYEITGAAMIAYRSRFPCSTVDGSEGERIVSYHTRIDHPRALDALEAALLVLADHERVPLTPDAVLRSKLQSAEQSRDKLRDAYAGLMLRLAKLAEKWLAEGAQAASLGGASDPVIRDVLRAAVWELREALKP